MEDWDGSVMGICSSFSQTSQLRPCYCLQTTYPLIQRLYNVKYLVKLSVTLLYFDLIHTMFPSSYTSLARSRTQCNHGCGIRVGGGGSHYHFYE